VACGAERIYLGPSEPVMVKGLRAEMMYFKKTLDKLGVSVEIEHAGKYKDFGDMFTRSDMSPETREVMTSVVDDLYGNLVAGIAAGRKRTPEDVRAIIDQGPFTAPQALKAGLVDELRFEDQMWGELKERLKGEPSKVSMDKYARITSESLGLSGKNKIAVVVGEGDIVRGSPGDDGSGEENLTSYGFNKLLRHINTETVKNEYIGWALVSVVEIWVESALLLYSTKSDDEIDFYVYEKIVKWIAYLPVSNVWDNMSRIQTEVELQSLEDFIFDSRSKEVFSERLIDEHPKYSATIRRWAESKGGKDA